MTVGGLLNQLSAVIVAAYWNVLCFDVLSVKIYK